MALTSQGYPIPPAPALVTIDKYLALIVPEHNTGGNPQYYDVQLDGEGYWVSGYAVVELS